MKKKFAVNIRLFVFIAILFLINSCNKTIKPPAGGILISTDSAFSAMSVKEGMHKAFLSFIADSGVMLRNNAYPLKGKHSLADLFSKRSDTSFVLEWTPLFEKVSDSGDLGYTYGTFSNTSVSTGERERGTYVTIWEKQEDGTWKFV
jgi:ketosteroid isomerase-like protein